VVKREYERESARVVLDRSARVDPVDVKSVRAPVRLALSDPELRRLKSNHDESARRAVPVAKARVP
jgi:riboflavin biosynthesis pyrimidine reductase